jgi:N-acylneuraminate cytidylyltransferase
MWVVRGNRMVPLLPLTPSKQPWHSSQYQSLPEVYAQNASLEIAWSRVVFENRTIAGHVLMPFFKKDYEGFDLNSDYDWKLAEHLVDSGQAPLPSVPQPPYPLEEYAE